MKPASKSDGTKQTSGEKSGHDFRLDVTVVCAAHLPQKDRLGSCDAYCILGPPRQKTVQTQVVKNSYSPQWKEVFSFNIHAPDEHVILKVFDWDRFGAHDFVGQAKIPVSAAHITDSDQVFGLFDGQDKPVLGKDRQQASVTIRLSVAQKNLSVVLQIKVVFHVILYFAVVCCHPHTYLRVLYTRPCESWFT
jgi:Ca2+-dependent lipid-binding protein